MTTTVLNTKFTEYENEILDTSTIETTTVLHAKFTEVENNIGDHAKNITTQEFNELTVESFAARLK